MSAREENGNNFQNEEAIRAELVKEFGEALTAEYVLKAENRNYEGEMALRKAKEWLMADKRAGKLKKPVEKRPPSYDIEEYERFAMSFPISYQQGGGHEEIRNTRDESPTIYEKEERS